MCTGRTCGETIDDVDESDDDDVDDDNDDIMMMMMMLLVIDCGCGSTSEPYIIILLIPYMRGALLISIEMIRKTLRESRPLSSSIY